MGHVDIPHNGFCKCDNISTTTSISTATTPDSSSCQEGQFCHYDSDCNGGECRTSLNGWSCKCDNIITTTSSSTLTPPTTTSSCEEGRYCSDDSDCNGGECSGEVPSPVMGIGFCKCDNITTSTPPTITTTDFSSCEEGQYCFDDSDCNGGECVEYPNSTNYGFCKCDNIATTTSISTSTSTSTTPKVAPLMMTIEMCLLSGNDGRNSGRPLANLGMKVVVVQCRSYETCVESDNSKILGNPLG